MDPLQGFVNSPVKASSIIGTTVVNAKDEVLGDIEEMVDDPDTGKIANAVGRRFRTSSGTAT